eukprot:4895792-Pleurochrysis_carterae.AAC.3
MQAPQSVSGARAVASSSAMEPMTTVSSPSSETHIGMGVPQKRLRDTAQSRALSSQLWKRFSCAEAERRRGAEGALWEKVGWDGRRTGCGKGRMQKGRDGEEEREGGGREGMRRQRKERMGRESEEETGVERKYACVRGREKVRCAGRRWSK